MSNSSTVVVPPNLSPDAQYAIRVIDHEIDCFRAAYGRKLHYTTLAVTKGLEPWQLTEEFLNELNSYFNPKGIELEVTERTCECEFCDCKSYGHPHPAFIIRWAIVRSSPRQW